MELLRLAVGTGSTVVLCAPPGAALDDPGPGATAARGVTLLAASAPETQLVERVVDAVARGLDAIGLLSVGVAGWSTGGTVALALAARRPDLVSRIAVIATPKPDPDDTLVFHPSEVRARTLLVYGGADPNAASIHGRWWQRNLLNARLEMTPDAVDLLRERWDRVLSHLAPRLVR